MIYAILGDIHANLEALQAVISDAKQQGVDRFVCTGDVVGYNANVGMPSSTQSNCLIAKEIMMNTVTNPITSFEILSMDTTTTITHENEPSNKPLL